MVISDFDVVGVAFSPVKADTPLIVYADAVLFSAVAAEGFKMVAGRNAK